MVFAINAPEEGEKTFATFQEKAKTAKHPDPALGETADFTPPPAKSSAPPSGSDSSSTPTGSDSTSAPQSSAEASDPAASGPAPSDSGASTPAAGPTNPATADQANISVAPSASTRPSGALSTVRVPGAGIALTLAGLLAGMLL